MKIGILGNGQLARMLSLSAYALGLQTLCLSPSGPNSANQVTQVIEGDWNNPETLQSFMQAVDVITYENENISLEVAKKITEKNRLYPPLQALATAQDRLLEKDLFTQLKIPTTAYVKVDEYSDLLRAVDIIGLPAVLKTRRFGYDGKGQYYITKMQDLKPAWEKLSGVRLILEKFITFDSEVSLIAVSNQNQTVYYPLTKNYHQDGILRLSLAPYLNDKLQSKAQSYMDKLLKSWEYVGILTLEFFQVANQLLANEIAPRVHNSGHWTIEGALTSQFENHLRAICQLPLGRTQAKGFSAMFNCISHMPSRKAILKYANTHYHDYTKQPRPGRKLGHINLNSQDESEFKSGVKTLSKVLNIKNPFT